VCREVLCTTPDAKGVVEVFEYITTMAWLLGLFR
jgi:hypothetical protein